MKKTLFCFLLFFFVLFDLSANGALKVDEKILICGVCRNVESHVKKVIENVEALAPFFKDYQVIFYENNSTDRTKPLFKEWEARNNHVCFLSEYLDPQEIPPARTEKIARARNIVLSAARDPKFEDFKYLLMVDLDSDWTWPIEELIKTIKTRVDWDCVGANDLYLQEGYYRDRYAFRDVNQPFGPEILGDLYWSELNKTWFKIDQQQGWRSVFSAFGGFAIYKTNSILPCSYSGTVNKDVENYYEFIFSKISRNNFQRTLYLGLLAKEKRKVSSKKPPIIFHHNTSSERPANYPYVTVCEHFSLHAAMALNGNGKFYVNPRMIVRFN